MHKPLLATVLLSSLFATSVFADVPAREPSCRACHGAKGGAPIAGIYPKLQGQNKEYLVAALKAYRDGLRKGGLSGVMVGQAKSLSDDDINALAAYYAEQ